MKQKILSAMLITGLATCAFGQGVVLDNTVNSGNVTATSNGLIFEKIGASTVLFDGANYNLGITLLGGSSVGTLAPIVTDTPATDPLGYTGSGPGQFVAENDATYNIPGVGAGGTAVLEIQFWVYDGPTATGTYSTYAQAVAGLDPVAQVTFNQTTGGPGTTPPSPASLLTLLPSVTLTAAPVPDPTTFAIAGLGIASLLAVRRRKA
jgi:hypothetical protein